MMVTASRVFVALVLGIAAVWAWTAVAQEAAEPIAAESASIPDTWLERDVRSKLYWNLRTEAPPPLDATVWHNVEQPVKLEDLRGKVVLLHFWATWNKQSLRVIPQLQELHEKHLDDGLEIIGVCNPFKGEAMISLAEQMRITWPLCVDEDKKIINAYIVDGYPDYYLIDRAGKLRVIDCKQEALEKAIALLLEEPAPKSDQESSVATADGEAAVAGETTAEANSPSKKEAPPATTGGDADDPA